MKISILTISDSRTFDNDESGRSIKKYAETEGFELVDYEIVCDEIEKIACALEKMLAKKVNIILTTGGTGITARDVTPEATQTIIEKEVPGIAEGIRWFSLQKTKNAMLSRGITGIKEKTLIVNLPGSKKAVNEILPYITDVLKHSKDMLAGINTQHS